MPSYRSTFALFRQRSRIYAVILLAAASCVATRADESTAPSETKESRVLWNSINRGSLRAIIQPAQDIRLSSRAAGIIQRYDADEGQPIKAGASIMVLDDDQEKAEVAQAEAVLRGTEAEVGHAEREYDRAKPLSEERIYSDKQFDEAKYALETARSRAAQAQAALTLARVRLANRTITSPISGIFLKKSKQIGESVERFEPVARIIDLSYLEIVVYCDASLFDILSGKGEIAVQVSKSEDRHVVVQGTVSYVDPIVDPSNGTFRIRVRIPSSADTAAGYTAILLPPTKSVPDAPK